MSDEEDAADKSFDPTPQKLAEARRKGEIARSTDLFTAGSYLGFFVAVILIGSWMVSSVGADLKLLLDQPVALSQNLVSDGPGLAFQGIAASISISLLPIFLLPALGVIVSVTLQKAWVFTPSKLTLKMSRVSIVKNAKNKFGKSGLFEFFKSAVKLMIYSVLLYLFIVLYVDDFISQIHAQFGSILLFVAEKLSSFILLVLIVAVILGTVDYLWQQNLHIEKNRMSRKEIADELKNDEGDPHMKQERRQRAMAASQSNLVSDVQSADVVIVNPTHYAVALKWDRQPGSAPVCVAKGVDSAAARIREIAMEANIAIHRDAPTARSIFAVTDVGQQIQPRDYKAVAAAIRFSEAMKQKAQNTYG